MRAEREVMSCVLMTKPHGISPVVSDGHSDEGLRAIADALPHSSVLVCLVSATGEVLASTGGFAPAGPLVGSLEQVLGGEALDPQLLKTIGIAAAGRSAAYVDTSVGGVACRAMASPVDGQSLRSLLVLTPDYGSTSSWSSAEPSEIDVGDLLVEREASLQTRLGATRELFVWTEREPLMTAVAPALVERAIELAFDLTILMQPTSGTSLMTARNVSHEGLAPDAVEVRLRTYADGVSRAFVDAFEAIFAEFEAATGISITLQRPMAYAVDVLIVLPRRTADRGAVSPDPMQPPTVSGLAGRPATRRSAG